MGKLNYALQIIGEEAKVCSHPESLFERYRNIRDEYLFDEASKIGGNIDELLRLYYLSSMLNEDKI